jgi:hypothetical protein
MLGCAVLRSPRNAMTEEAHAKKNKFLAFCRSR